MLFHRNAVRTFSSKVFRSSSGQTPDQFIKTVEKMKLNKNKFVKSISKETITEIETKIKNAPNVTQMQYQFKNFYLPLFDYISHKRMEILDTLNKIEKIQSHESNKFKKTLFIGVSAPQGCGKTTLTEYMQLMFESVGLSCLSISLDDFYLTGEQQDELARQNPNNPLLQYRGNAGTHDVQLLLKTLDDVSQNQSVIANSLNHISSSSKQLIKVPKYDKSLRSGRGDRADISQWTSVSLNDLPVDIVLLEGWMLGFEPLPTDTNNTSSDNTSNTLSNHMIEINNFLKKYKTIHEMMDCWIVLAVETQPSSSSLDNILHTENNLSISIADKMKSLVFKWRMEAENQMRKKQITTTQQNNNKSGAMTEEQVYDFVSRFMPAYAAYLPRLYTYGPQRRLALSSPTHQHCSNNNDKAITACVTDHDSDSDSIPVLKVIVDEYRAPVTFYELK